MKKIRAMARVLKDALTTAYPMAQIDEAITASLEVAASFFWSAAHFSGENIDTLSDADEAAKDDARADAHEEHREHIGFVWRAVGVCVYELAD